MACGGSRSLLALVLLLGCAGPEEAPTPRRQSEARAAQDRSGPATVKISGPASPPPARDPTQPADPERVAELARRLKAEAGRAPPRERGGQPPPPPPDDLEAGAYPAEPPPEPAPGEPAPPEPARADEPEGADEPARADEPERSLLSLDLDGLVKALGEALRRADAIEPLPREADRTSLGAEDRQLDRLERRLRGVAYRLQVRLDERIRAWERETAAEDAPLWAEEQRLLGRSAAVVIGPDRAYVDSPDEDLELVRAQRAELALAHRERVASLRAAYEPLLTRAAAARADVGTARRAVQRRIAALD